MIKIMFVCHGNICRSPMAEFIMKDIIKKNGKENDFYIESSATSSEEIFCGIGNPVYPPAKRKLAEEGISCEGKRAVKLTRDDYEKFDYLICMDDNNIRNALYILGPDKDNKLSKLLDWTGSGKNVADPWYSCDFDSAFNDILSGCEALFEKLNKD